MYIRTYIYKETLSSQNLLHYTIPSCRFIQYVLPHHFIQPELHVNISSNGHLIEKVVVSVKLEFGDDYSQQCLQVSSVIVRQIGVVLNVRREM